MGGKHLFIDEIHKYDDWSREVKQIYDSYEDLQIVISGSSILDIYKGMADLSRRLPIYEMQGLSFREYLRLFHGINVPVYSLNEISTLNILCLCSRIIFAGDIILSDVMRNMKWSCFR